MAVADQRIIASREAEEAVVDIIAEEVDDEQPPGVQESKEEAPQRKASEKARLAGETRRAEAKRAEKARLAAADKPTEGAKGDLSSGSGSNSSLKSGMKKFRKARTKIASICVVQHVYLVLIIFFIFKYDFFL